MIDDDLYRRGFSTPMLKCLAKDEVRYVMDELHNDICSFHTGRRVLKARLRRVGYFWPMMEEDTKTFIQKCLRCQAHSNDTHKPPHTLHTIVSPWPFAQWVMDIVGSFPPGQAQKKFLLVAINYFNEWVKAEPLATITATKDDNIG